MQYVNHYKVYVHARHPVAIYVKYVANALERRTKSQYED